MKKTDGFSLIELVIGILASALVSGAIITFLLMGMDTSNATFDANADQRNAKTVISMLENLASEGTITKLEVNGALAENENGSFTEAGNRSWFLYGKDESDILLSYSPAEQKLYSHGTVLMEHVTASMLTLSPSPLGGCLLGFALQTPESFYETSVYNRLATIATEGLVLDKNNFAIIDSDPNPSLSDEAPTSHSLSISNHAGRTAFLKVLLSQYGSTGTIIRNGVSSNIPYSLWYCNGSYPGTWNENTPWCACFVSWAINVQQDNLNQVPREANVDTLFSRFHTYFTIDPESAAGNVLPGDLIFFDWDPDPTSVNNPDLEHVGVVLFIENGYVYTIEGNSGNQVALRRYALNDSSIFRYARLDWRT